MDVSLCELLFTQATHDPANLSLGFLTFSLVYFRASRVVNLHKLPLVLLFGASEF